MGSEISKESEATALHREHNEIMMETVWKYKPLDGLLGDDFDQIIEMDRIIMQQQILKEKNAVIGSGGVAYFIPLDDGVTGKISTPPARLTRKSIPKMDLFTAEEKVLMAQIIRRDQLKKKGKQARIADERRARVEQRRKELEQAKFEMRVLEEVDKEEELKGLEKETTEMQEKLEDRKRRLEELARKTKLKAVTSRGIAITVDQAMCRQESASFSSA